MNKASVFLLRFRGGKANARRLWAKRRGRLSPRRLHAELLEGRLLLNSDPVLWWNQVALDAALADSRADVAEQGGPTRNVAGDGHRPRGHVRRLERCAAGIRAVSGVPAGDVAAPPARRRWLRPHA